MAQQPAHFFDRVPASDAAAASSRRAYVQLDPTTGHYVLSDTLPLGIGETQAYFETAADGAVVLSSTPPGDHVAALYGDGTVQLL